MKTNYKRLFLLLILFFGISISYSQQWKWAKGAGESGDDDIWATALDKSKTHIYATGYFSNTITIGTATLTSVGAGDIFLSKYDTAGNVVWAKRIGGGTGFDASGYVTEDDSSNVYMSGTFTGNATFGAFTFNGSVNGGSGFIAKLDSSGQLIWIKEMTSTSACFSSCVVVDKVGDLVVVGAFSDTLSLGTTTVVSASVGQNDGFLAKYSPAGNLIWIKTGGGLNDNAVAALAVDMNNDIVCTGWFTQSATFGSQAIVGNGLNANVLIAKYSSSGNIIWLKSAGGPATSYSNWITTDQSGNCYVNGYFRVSATFGATTITSLGQEDIFLAKYDQNGNSIWVRKLGGTSFDASYGLATDNQSNSFITGYFSSTVAQVGTSKGSSDIFVTKYDSAGNLQWSQTAGGKGVDYGYWLVLDNAKNIYVAGISKDSCYFGNDTVLNKGSWDMYLAKLYDTAATTIGIKETQQNISLNIFPNPFQNSITLKLNSSANEQLKISVVDVLGKEFFSTKLRADGDGKLQTQIVFPEIADGIYFLQVRNEIGVLKSEIIIKN